MIKEIPEGKETGPIVEKTYRWSIKGLKKDINRLEREKIAETDVKRNRKIRNLGDQYEIKGEGLVRVIEERKQRLLVKSMKINGTEIK